MRRSLVMLFATALAVVPTSPSAGAPPEDFEVDISYDAGQVCDFPRNLEGSGKTKTLERDGYVIITGPKNVFTLTNVDTGADTTVRIAGIFKDTNLGEGLVASVATGRNLVLTPNAGAVVLVGRYEFTLDEDTGELVGAYEGRGKIIDLCARLG